MTEELETRAVLSVWNSAVLTQNYWLRMLLVFACVAVAAESGAIGFMVYQDAHRKIPVVRVDQAGRPEFMATADYNFKPNENEIGYFLHTFVTEYYSRRRATLKEDWTGSLKFLDKPLEEVAMNRENREKWIEAYGSSGEPEIEVEVLNIALSPRPTQPYGAVVEFNEHRIVSGSESGKPTTMYANVLFIADPKLGNVTNPLGFLITQMSVGNTLVPVE